MSDATTVRQNFRFQLEFELIYIYYWKIKYFLTFYAHEMSVCGLHSLISRRAGSDGNLSYQALIAEPSEVPVHSP